MLIDSYDTAINRVNTRNPFISIRYKQLVCRVKTRKRFFIGKKYKDNQVDYFLIMTDDRNKNTFNCSKDCYGRFKFYLGQIWNDLGLTNENNDFNIELKLVDNDENTEVYKIVY